MVILRSGKEFLFPFQLKELRIPPLKKIYTNNLLFIYIYIYICKKKQKIKIIVIIRKVLEIEGPAAGQPLDTSAGPGANTSTMDLKQISPPSDIPRNPR